MSNPYHKPAGSPEGGEFTSGPDSAAAKDTAKRHKPGGLRGYLEQQSGHEAQVRESKESIAAKTEKARAAAEIEAKRIAGVETHIVSVRMNDPTLVASGAKGIVKNIKVTAGSDAEAEARAEKFYKKRGYTNVTPYLVLKHK